MKEALLAQRYIKALLNSLSKDVKESSLAEVVSVCDSLLSNEEAMGFFTSQLVPADLKTEAINKLYGGSGAHENVIKFFIILAKSGRMSLLASVKQIATENLYDLKECINANIYVSTPLNSDQKTTILSYLKDATSKTIEPNFEEDDSLLAGFKVHVGNVIYDATLENNLEKLERSIKKINLI